MRPVTVTLLAAVLAAGHSHSPKDDSRYNVGWSSFLNDEPTEFHNLPLTWETDAPIPDYVVGSYIKNGPSQKSFGSENRWYNSYMDSWAKLNKITFTESGEVHFSGRMIESKNFVRCRDANEIKPSITMAGVTPEDFNMEEMMEGGMHGFDNTNVLLWRLGSEANGTYIASTDYPLVNIIDPEDLGVLGQATPPLRDGITMTSSSHWIREPGTDNSLNFGIVMNPLSMDQDFVLYRYGSTMEDHKEVARFPAPWLSMIHMISTSEHYAVIIFYPVKMNMISAPSKSISFYDNSPTLFFNIAVHHMHILETLELVDSPTLIYLIDLRDGTVLDGFETDDPSMVYGTHITNSWEEGEEELVLDVATNPWSALATFFDLELMANHPSTDREDADSVMKRVRLNLKTKQTTVEDWPSLPGSPVWTNTVDFPVLNDRMYGYKNR